MSLYCNHCMNILSEGSNFCSYCGKSNSAEIPSHHLLPGTVLNGKFLVGEALGEGGFGITYIGRDLNLDMRVAVKEFFPSGYVNRTNSVTAGINDITSESRKDFFEKGKERFLNEARILARFSGEPGIVDVRDFFEENNTAYIIMEFLDGTDLKSYLKQNGTLSPENAVNMLYPVMQSLKKVHAQGLIHRDISPDNIMILDNTVKLLDFGAARNVSAEANKSLSVMLKPGYAPEEQYRSKGNQGPWTDVYAICATMYKCITGITPDDSAQRVFSDEVKTPSALGISISPVIENAVMRGMAVHQQDRFQNIDELLSALQGNAVPLSTSGKTTAQIPPAAPVNTVAGDNYTAYQNGSAPQISAVNAIEAQNKKPSKKPVIIAAALIALIAVILVVVFVFVVPSLGDKEDEKDGGKESTSQEQSDTAEGTETEISDETASAEGSSESEDAAGPDAPAEMSDDLFDFTLTLKGQVYQLPCSIDDFIANGWEVNERYTSLDDYVPGMSYETVYIENGADEISLYVYNYSGNAKLVKDCKIGEIDCFTGDVKDFSIAKGITPSSSVEDIINAFGTPDERYDEDYYTSLTYYVDSDSSNYYNCYEFYCYEETSSSHICVSNYVKSSEDKTETDKSVPEYLSDYIAPESLGTDMYSGIISIDGDLYQLPAPFSAFTDNGWKVKSAPGFVVSGGNEYIVLQKGACSISVTVCNFGMKQTLPENCAVICVDTETYSDSEKTAFELPGDGAKLKVGMAEADALKFVTDDYYVYNGTDYDSYSYDDYTDGIFSLTFYIDHESRLVSNIELRCDEWNY